jgi:hypothetical protein
MQEFDKIGEDLFNKIRGRFPEVTIGDAEGTVTNEPSMARFFDFDYNGLGKVSVAIEEDDGLTIIYSKDFMEDQDELTQEAWYDFLKELRVFSKKRMLKYSVRDVTKSNLNKRDYKFLAKTPEDENMNESKLYGTSRISYQKIGEARIVIKHTEGVNQESAAGRTRSIGKIYIESAEGERFIYPFKHLSGARAMARHVAEGGKPHDEFGGHIVGLSEEMSKLRKFNNYMGRSAVMAESLSGYVDAVKERISTVKKTIESLQKPKFYAETFAAYSKPIMEDVPTDVAENWIDQLTIKQFNEELADVFPYIYNLVSEATKAKSLGPEDLAEQQLDEILPALAIPALMTAARVAIPSLIKAGAKIVAKGSLGTAKLAAKGVGKVGVGTTAAIGGGAYVGKQAVDAIDDVKGQAQDAMDGATDQAAAIAANAKDLLSKADGSIDEIKGQISAALGGGAFAKIAAFASKYALPGLAVVAILYGGKKIINMIRGKSESMQAVSDESIAEAINIAEQDCWDGYKKAGTQKGTGKNKGKRVNKCVPEDAELEQGFEEMMGQFGEGQFKRDMTDDAQDMDKEEFMNKYSDYGEEEASAMWDDMNEGDDDTMDVKIDKDGSISKDDGHEEKEQKTPLGEFILSYFDRENGAFPKGETAVLTMVEKDYGEEYINPAKEFIEQVTAKFEEIQMRNNPQQMETNVDEDFTQAAAAAARAHQSEFEYPKGSGKMHPVKMSKGTAHEINDDFDRIRELAGLR